MRLIYIILISFMVTSANAQSTSMDEKYRLDVHYQIIPDQPKPSAKKLITVTEFFSYGCRHCYHFEPFVQEWKKSLPANVKFIGSPVVWQKSMATQAKLYYTASSLGLLPALHEQFFKAIHSDLSESNAIVDLLKSQGINVDEFFKKMDSPDIASQLSSAELQQKKFLITGTPQLVVGDYYHITTRLAGGNEEMLDVASFLLKKIASE